MRSTTGIRVASWAVLLLGVWAGAACKQQERKEVDDVPGANPSTGTGFETSGGGGAGGSGTTTGTATTGGAGGGTGSEFDAACAAFCAKATELGCGEGCTFGCGVLTTCLDENAAWYACAAATPDYIYCDGPSTVRTDPSKGCEAESAALATCG